MSRIIATAAIRGARKYVAEAETKLSEVLEEKGPEQEVVFPNTGFYLPLILSMTGIEVKTLQDIKEPL
ncbi:hypothetical protein KAV67_04985, partial [Candidatus Bipolaricaulota bacterium]|nr:hypothetical protein [Candidatus Bipolaricaulota bacterium]